jgi:hypothetical protein
VISWQVYVAERVWLVNERGRARLSPVGKHDIHHGQEDEQETHSHHQIRCIFSFPHRFSAAAHYRHAIALSKRIPRTE